MRAATGAQAGGVIDNEDVLHLIGNFPIARLTAFPGFGITPEVLKNLGA